MASPAQKHIVRTRNQPTGVGDILVTLDGKPLATLDYQTMGPAR